MSEPILSREEVEALAHRICMKYVHSDNENMRQYTFGMLTLKQFAEAYEAALLKNLRGEPVAEIIDVGSGTPQPHIVGLANLHQFESGTKLYAIKIGDES
ncbi:hypothetical protein [Burkholderia ubonensis]|uniref:hypothetical protein n=1 Tax=Burkholderia ubonensis TaxID=101571 RepID=UPI0009B3EFC7|nr:hypothetical protein [Burkholderia ubonensis]